MSYYREQAIKTANAYLEANPIFLDTETTGLGQRDEIVEISILEYDGTVLLDTLVKPGRKIPYDASRIHGITDQIVQDAPAWFHVWPKVEEIIKGHVLGIYNAEFDLRMMKQSHQNLGMPWRFPQAQVFCIMKLYTSYIGSRRWQSLGNAGRQSGINLPNTHRTLDDTLLAREVFLKITGQNE